MSEAVVRRMDPGRNMARFYRMDIQADLFGEWCFVREWGRIGQAGQTRQAVYPSQAAHCRPRAPARIFKQGDFESEKVGRFMIKSSRGTAWERDDRQR
jgi:predicted DNA-binding WGR domain protein